MSWLRDFNRRQFEDTLTAVSEGDDKEPAWVREHTRQIKEAEILDRIKEFEANLQNVREKEKRDASIRKTHLKRTKQDISFEEDEDFFLLKEDVNPTIDATTSALLASLDETSVPDM